MLTQLMVLTAMALMSWLAFRWIRQEIARVDRQMARTRRVLGRGRMRLEFDPATGHWHPVLRG
jgi:hypothetical protein